MADSIDFDTSDLIRLTVDLSRAPTIAAAAARAIVQKGSLNIKNQMIAEASGHSTLPYFPQSITYETRELAFAAEGIIGPDKDRPQGALGNLLYFGSSKNAPVFNLIGPLEAEAPKFIAALTAAAAKAVDV